MTPASSSPAKAGDPVNTGLNLMGDPEPHRVRGDYWVPRLRGA